MAITNKLSSLYLSTALLALSGATAVPTLAAENLVAAKETVVDHSLPRKQLDAEILAARRYDTFWATGDESMARAALAPDFMDRTLPAGREQGVTGPLVASAGFRRAVPDLQCDIQQMLVAGDRVVVHLHFTGHFSGSFNGVQGKGQDIDFIATDIYRIANGRIQENWHIEDNLTLMKQLGVVAK
jgi:predicted ester cyclase